ncbi:uncharacterized protein LOC123875195 [Maniola jurtina]|uniref:uncharacterized protein LOC123875195 n=1 Tax=Maniola jurtina TaxID=191418 RepID=UPI001E68E7AF|nr:uncharacterized protein LOC123875195 [Maniola jurtina]
MDIYKQYLYKLQKLTLKDPYIHLLDEDEIPKMKEYIRKLNSISFDEGTYHTYFGEIKTIVNSFNLYWTDIMDEAIKEADRCSHCVKLNEIIEKTHKTMLIHKVTQADFETEFLPLNTPLEEQAYNEIVDKYTTFMKNLEEFIHDLKRLDRQEKVDVFAKEQFPKSLKIKNDVFVFTYNHISYLLSFFVDRIRVSIEEIFLRLRNNVRSIQEQSDSYVTDLLTRLYEKNKEHLQIYRQDNRASVELAEVQRSMTIIKDKIEDSKQRPVHRLQEECKYWEEKLSEFQQIHSCMKKLQEEENRVLEQQKLFNSMKDTEIPAPKQKCWENMGDKFKEKLQEIDELKLNAAKALYTFFSVRGPDRIFYSDNIGRYYMDDYGHQCYVLDHGLSVYHVNCQGEFVEVHNKDKYFYDSMGRFYIDKDTQEKLYQIAPCTSSYKIQNDIFVKHSKDCGHSEKHNKECRTFVKDPTDGIILPPIPPVDIQGKLDPEAVKFLWDTFGHILPDVLHDVAEARPKNPIHTLAHKLLTYKYKRTNAETELKKQEADMYRSKIYQDRLEKASASYKAWKKKQTRHRKPDEIDDSEEKSAFNAHVAKQEFIQSLGNYDN